MKRTILILGLVTALMIPGDAVLYTVLPSQPAALGVGLTAATLGLVLSVNRLIRVVVSSPLGVLSDRRGRRPIFLLGAVLGLGSTAGYVLLPGVVPLLLARLTWGIAWAALMVAGYGAILDLVHESRRGAVMGVYQWMIFSGGTLAMLIGGFLSDRGGLPITLWGCVGLAVVGLVLALTLPETRFQGTVAFQGAGLRGTLIALANRDLAVVSLVNFTLYLGGSGLLLSTLGYFLNELQTAEGDALGIATLTGALLAVQGLVSFSLAPVVGHLSDRVGRRWPFVLAGLALGTVSLAGFALAPGLTTAAGALVLFALARGLIPAPLAAWAGDVAPPHQRGLAIGAYLTLGDLGSGIGPILAYAIVDIWNVRWAYALGAAAFGLMLVVLLGTLARQRVGPRRAATNP
ncbi:MAG: MFS transporter [Chloroflexi bacterium]|nr:MFS transporter [Chloroflexota bacterium]MBU1746627.1 MFS transporter [Chloroflexota bacterium]